MPSLLNIGLTPQHKFLSSKNILVFVKCVDGLIPEHRRTHYNYHHDTGMLIKGFRTETMLTELEGGTTGKSRNILMVKRGRFVVLFIRLNGWLYFYSGYIDDL